MKSIYTAIVHGDKVGVTTSDNQLNVPLGLPVEMGGDGVSGTNPEQLFAAAYIACFTGTLGLVAGKRRIKLAELPRATCSCALVKAAEGPGYVFAVELKVELPGLDDSTREQLVAEADQLCPVSNTLRGQSQVSVIHH